MSRRFDLKDRLLFASAYHHASTEDKEKFLQASQKLYAFEDGIEFLVKAFSVGEISGELGLKLVKRVLEDPQLAYFILCHYQNITWKLSALTEGSIHQALLALGINPSEGWTEILTAVQEKLDKAVFRQTLQEKGEEFLRYMTSGEEGDVERLKPFDASTVFWGAIFKGVIAKTGIKGASEVLETLMKGSSIRIEQGGPHLIQKTTNDEDKEIFIYPNPDLFSEKDHLAIQTHLRASVAKNDQKTLSYLERHLTIDLANPEATWIFIRKEGVVVAELKIMSAYNEEGHRIPNEYYIGTYYVEPLLKNNYGLGGALMAIGESILPPGSRMRGSCALINPSLELYSEKYGATFTGLVSERDADGACYELFNVVFGDKKEYQCSAYTQEHIREIAKKISSLEEIETKEAVCALQLDTSPEGVPPFSEVIKKFEQKGFAGKRIFYEKTSKGEADLKNTFVVFERAF